MRLGARQFRPTLIGTLATVPMLALLLSLGAWQLRRADEKRALLEQYAQGHSTTQRLIAANVAELPLFQTVVVEGRYDSGRQILLDNMPSARTLQNGRAVGGLPGYQALTPLLTDDGHIVLVNRGWLPLGASRDTPPDIEAPSNHRQVRGRLSELQAPGLRLAQPSETTWPRVLNYPSLDDVQALYGTTLLPRIVLLDPAEPDGFVRDWTTRYNFGDFGPDKHTGYAVQWFGLAFALVVIYFVVGFKPT